MPWAARSCILAGYVAMLLPVSTSEFPLEFIIGVRACTGHALDGLSLPLLEALAGSPAVAQHAPDLAMQLRQVLDRRRPFGGDGGHATDRAPFRAGMAGGSSTLELQAFTSDGLQRRSQVGSLCLPDAVKLILLLPAYLCLQVWPVPQDVLQAHAARLQVGCACAC